MMTYTKNKKLIIFVLVIVGCIVISKAKGCRGGNVAEFVMQEISPEYNTIQIAVSATGSIRPQNRLELKPSINGRIENIMVKEGVRVKKGDILVWMSSAERAALLDAAKIQGEETVKYWQEVFKATPIIAPIDGEVIVRKVEPGQTVTSAEAILVLSDRLIVEALLDETDIGKIKVGNPVTLSLDAYPQEKISGVVDHISYESTVENNVTKYAVEIVPSQVPEFFRSGMNANVEIIVEKRSDVLCVPVETVQEEATNKTLENIVKFILVKEKGAGKPIKKNVKLGLSDGKNIEVVSGLSIEDKVIIQTKKFTLPNKRSGKNPLDPASYQKQNTDSQK